ncbi:hypothetical protein [Roseovarius sp. D0-M9]
MAGSVPFSARAAFSPSQITITEDSLIPRHKRAIDAVLKLASQDSK